MRNYDKGQPLIMVHIPKTAGTSVREVLEGWYGEGLLLHYFDALTDKMPLRHDVFNIHSAEKPVVVYGHFNASRNFGIQDYYPQVRQFITILRDPLEARVSGYFFLQKGSSRHIAKHHPESQQAKLKDFILSGRSGMLNFFPEKVTFDNYQRLIEEHYIEIGITEYLGESMKRIAKKLDQSFDAAFLPHFNTSEKTQFISDDLKDEFIENHRLEYCVYNYVLSNYQ